MFSRPKRRRRLPERDPLSFFEDERQSENPWRQNYATLTGLADKVVAVLEDQVSRGQVLKFTEAEAVARYPDLLIGSLAANRKDKPNGVVTARVLHDGTSGLAVNTRTQGEVSVSVGFEASHEGKSRSPTAHLCAHGRRERSAPVGTSSSIGLEVSRLSRGEGRSSVREHCRDVRYQFSFVLLQQSCCSCGRV